MLWKATNVEKKNRDSEHLVVYVNDRPKRLFIGLKVRHAIGSRRTRAVQSHRAVVRDADGNRVDVDGALFNGERLYVAPTSPTAFADDLLRRSGPAENE